MMFNRHVRIRDKSAGEGFPCLIIAEAGVNHFGSLQKAFDLVDMAVEAKADIFKIQHYKTDLLVGERASDWRMRLRSRELSDDAVLQIQERCRKKGIVFMCTAHEEQALDFLDKNADVPAFKVGSGEVENWPFLKLIAQRRKPLIVSTGMYEMEQIQQMANVVSDTGNRDLAILHCITTYPTDPEDVNLSVMNEIRSFFAGPVGYSDHTEGTAVPLAAVALGADIIEKHITIDRDVPNAQDWKVSCDPSNFGRFVSDVREIEAARGDSPKTMSERELQSLQWARKSLVAVRDIPYGVIITEDMLIAQRPGDGIPPSRMHELIGRSTNCRISSGDLLSLDMIA